MCHRDFQITDDGNELARDGKAFGHLMVRGPWITNGCFKDYTLPTARG